MYSPRMKSTPILLAAGLSGLLLLRSVAAQQQYPALPSETPVKFDAVTDSFDYVKRDVMIPMRDGVKLHTVILIPKRAKGLGEAMREFRKAQNEIHDEIRTDDPKSNRPPENKPLS